MPYIERAWNALVGHGPEELKERGRYRERSDSERIQKIGNEADRREQWRGCRVFVPGKRPDQGCDQHERDEDQRDDEQRVRHGCRRYAYKAAISLVAAALK